MNCSKSYWGGRLAIMKGSAWKILWMGIIVVVLGWWGNGEMVGLVHAQDSTSQPQGTIASDTLKQIVPEAPVPFAHYEERLRQSEKWKTMTEAERQQAIQKIAELRKKFLERQQRVKKQYGLADAGNKKKRESLMSRRRKIEQENSEGLWEKFQALPLQRRLEMERELGLSRVLPSQRRKQFEERLRRLPFSRREKVTRELELSVR